MSHNEEKKLTERSAAVDTRISTGIGNSRLRAAFNTLRGFRSGTLLLIIVVLGIIMSFASPVSLSPG